MRTRHFVFLALLAALNVAQGQTSSSQVTQFKIDSYSLEYPANWTYKPQAAPDGSQLHMFYGPQEHNALPYCHATQQPLNPALAPRTAKMNAKQRADFFATSSDQNLLFSLYDNLASAQGFRLIHANAVAIGQAFPAFSADFLFRTPQGFVYRVRSHYTFWQKAQLSVWCQTVSRNESSADDAFLRNLATFQRFVASIRITP